MSLTRRTHMSVLLLLVCFCVCGCVCFVFVRVCVYACALLWPCVWHVSVVACLALPESSGSSSVLCLNKEPFCESVRENTCVYYTCLIALGGETLSVIDISLYCLCCLWTQLPIIRPSSPLDGGPEGQNTTAIQKTQQHFVECWNKTPRN